MTDINQIIERDERAMERIAGALERIAGVEEKRFKADHPEVKKKQKAVIMRPSDEKRDQFSDRATPEWIDETERVSRFERRHKSAETDQASQGTGPEKTAGEP